MGVQIFDTTPEQCADYFRQKLEFTTGPVEVEDFLRLDQRIAIIDVRAAEDYNEGHIPGAINLPEDQWDTLAGLKKDTVNFVYCYSHVCHLAARANYFFASRGFRVMEIDGGWKSWMEHELPVEKGPWGFKNKYREDQERPSQSQAQ